MSEQNQPGELSSRPKSEAGRIATMAAYVGGAVAAAGALGIGVLCGQVLIARKIIPGAEAPPPRSNGRYGTQYSDATPLRLAVLGDSTAAGYGVRTRAETPGALLSTWIADAAKRPVTLTCPAVVGSVSAWLPVQVETAIAAGVDLAIVLIGANDVTTRASEAAAVQHLADAVTALRDAGAEVVVATCPDLGTVRPIHPPLRWLARRWSRQLAAAQTVAVVRAGGRTVSLGDLLAPKFYAAPKEMFGQDNFHPSVQGYEAAAAVVLPAALAALGLTPAPRAISRSLPLPDAAAAAVANPGSQVSAGTTTLASHGIAGGPVGRSRRLRALRGRLRGVAAARGAVKAVPSVGMRSAVAPSSAE